ncbi:MAG: OmpA family protein [Anaerolineales bacterium]
MQHELKPEHETGLVEIAAEIAAALAHSPLVEVDIEGQASLTGSDEINDPLSQRRAQSVRQALIGDGLDASRMRLASVGRRKSRPAVSQENLARSRAVLIVVEPRFATQQPLPEMPATTPVMTNPIQIGDCTIALSMLAMEGGPVTYVLHGQCGRDAGELRQPALRSYRASIHSNGIQGWLAASRRDQHLGAGFGRSISHLHAARIVYGNAGGGIQ